MGLLSTGTKLSSTRYTYSQSPYHFMGSELPAVLSLAWSLELEKLRIPSFLISLS